MTGSGKIRIFISVKSEDDLGGNVEGFVADLQKELADQELDAKAFFYVSGIDSGDQWAERLKSELEAAHVFIPLVSPNYFRSEVCSKEWSYFERRMGKRADNYGLLQPVMWAPPQFIDPPKKSNVNRLNFAPGEVKFDIGSGRLSEAYGKYIDRGLQQLKETDSASYHAIVVELVAEIGRRYNGRKLLLLSDVHLNEDAKDWRLKFVPREPPEPLRVLVHHTAKEAGPDKIRKFVDDLGRYLAYLGHPRSEISLASTRSLAEGENWLADRLQELVRCHVFVPLLGRNYSEAGLRAWWLVEDRVKDRPAAGHVFPVLWLNAEAANILPAVREVYQIGNGEDEKVYREQGLRHLLVESLAGPNPAAGLYQSQLWKWTQRIITAFSGEKTPNQLMPASQASKYTYKNCRPRFEPRLEEDLADFPPACLVRLAAAVDEQGENGRDPVDELADNHFGDRRPDARIYYGPSRDDWRPYVGIDYSGEQLIVQAREAIRAAMPPGEFDPDDELVVEIEDIGRIGSLTPIMVADVFMLGSRRRQEAVNCFLATYQCHMFVPKNVEDAQSVEILDGNHPDVFPRIIEATPFEHSQVHVPESHRDFYIWVQQAVTAKGSIPAFGGWSR